MVQSIIWTANAVNNLKDIAQSEEDETRKYTKVKVLLNSLKHLENFPLSGRKLPELSNRYYYEFNSGNYRVIFKANEHQTTLHILAILQQHRH